MEFKELVLNVPLSTEIEVNIRSKKDIEEILDKVSDMKNKEKILSSLIDNVQMEDDNLLFISNESSGWDLNPEYKPQEPPTLDDPMLRQFLFPNFGLRKAIYKVLNTKKTDAEQTAGIITAVATWMILGALKLTVSKSFISVISIPVPLKSLTAWLKEVLTYVPKVISGTHNFTNYESLIKKQSTDTVKALEDLCEDTTWIGFDYSKWIPTSSKLDKPNFEIFEKVMKLVEQVMAKAAIASNLANNPSLYNTMLGIPTIFKDANDFLSAFMSAGIKLSLLINQSPSVIFPILP